MLDDFTDHRGEPWVLKCWTILIAMTLLFKTLLLFTKKTSPTVIVIWFYLWHHYFTYIPSTHNFWELLENNNKHDDPATTTSLALAMNNLHKSSLSVCIQVKLLEYLVYQCYSHNHIQRTARPFPTYLLDKTTKLRINY